MLNMVFFMVLQFQDLQDVSPLDSDSMYNCRSDSLVDNFLKLFMSEIILRYAFYLYWYIHRRVKGLIKGEDWRSDFELSDEFVWFLAINQIMWSILIMYPIMAYVAVIVLLVHSRYLIFRLRMQKKQPKVASNDMSTGAMMNKYLFLTFLINCVFYSAVMFLTQPKFKYWVPSTDGGEGVFDATVNCGPFKDDNLSPIEEVGLFPKNDSLSSRFVFCIMVQFSVYTILYMISHNSNVHLEILQKVKQLKFREFEQKIQELQEKLNKLDMKEKLLR